jgi:Mitochondrial branched-chain alpha-ketoacid dehydrogenase kinase
VESFKELRGFRQVRDAADEREFTQLLQHIYSRHKNVVPVMAMGVAELKKVRRPLRRDGQTATCGRGVRLACLPMVLGLGISANGVRAWRIYGQVCRCSSQRSRG